ncbi:hypothetical protein MNV49_000188 [Pseudohyphozyma bogoriensis]|nr:hypothetical protein MNV49_000188 [Pseudohyphozyma bogoriensis]
MSSYPGHTPAPLRRNNSAARPQLDTPTPAPSSGHTSVLITSLKPARSRSSLSGDFHRDSSNKNNFSKQFKSFGNHASTLPNSSRVPLGYSSGRQVNIPDLNTDDLDLDNLEITTDGTERERRNLEEEIRRGMGELERKSDASVSDHDSVGFGDLSETDDRRPGGFRARMEDPSESSSDSLGDDFSLQIGMAGRRASRDDRVPPPVDQLSDNDDDSDRDLTYLTLDRSVISPAKMSAPPPAPSAAAPPGASAPTRGLGREFERATTNNNNAGSKPFGTTTTAATADGARRALGDNYASSAPFGQQSKSVPITTTHAPRLVPFPSAYSSATKLASVSPSSIPRFPQTKVPNNTRENGFTPTTVAADGFTRRPDDSRIRLPDVTGLTEGLRSPARPRGNIPVSQASTGAEDVAISGALDQLRKRLSSLERENSMSAARVRELEAQIEEDSRHSKERETPAVQPVQQQRSPAGTWEVKLKEEREKREALEALVARLRSHVTHLSHSLEDHSATLSALRSAPKPHHPDEGLVEEVHALRQGLEGLGADVDVVKNVVDGLVRERQAADEWDKEEKERRRDMERNERVEMEGLARKFQQQEPLRSAKPVQEDPDRTPRPSRFTGEWTGPETPKTGRSFLDAAEIKRLQQDLAMEEARLSPSPRPRKTRVVPPEETETDDELHASFERAEQIFRSVSAPKRDGDLCSVCRKRRKSEGVPRSAPAKMQERRDVDYDAGDESYQDSEQESIRPKVSKKAEKERRPDPRLALESVLRDLEADFGLHKRIYIELSDQYRVMDSKAESAKRRTLAEHLKESIDTLEVKADQVKRLHDLLHYNHPTAAPAASPPRGFGHGRMRESII